MPTPEERLTALEDRVDDLVVQVDNIEEQVSTRVPALEVAVADIDDRLDQVKGVFESYRDKIEKIVDYILRINIRLDTSVAALKRTIRRITDKRILG